MTSSVSKKKQQLDIDEHGEEVEETTKMLIQPIDNDESNDETTPSQNSKHETTTLNHTATSAATSDWYLEGVRRVRYDHVQRKMRYLTGTAAIGGFLFGYDTGVISGAMLPIRRTFLLSDGQQEVIVSSTIMAAFLSSFIIGEPMNTMYGRRVAILFAAFAFAIGSCCLGVAWSYTTLVLGRIIVGIGIGVASLTTPIYIAEVAIPRMRGKLVTINAFMCTFGQFIAGMVDGVFIELFPNDGWRYMLGLAVIPGLVMFYGFWKLPESPRWLVQNGNHDLALQVLTTLRESDQEAIDELAEILESVASHCDKPNQDDDVNELVQHQQQLDEPSREYGTAARTRESIKVSKGVISRSIEMLSNGPTRRAVVLGCGLMVIQQCCGINTVMYYAGTIYEMSNFDEVTAVWLSGFTALAQVLGVAISIFLVDRVGRRALVLSSLFGVALSLIGLGTSFYLSRVTSERIRHAVGSCARQTALVWSGTTTYCYDCSNMEGCGFCNGICIEGNETSPTDTSLCPDFATGWTYHTCQNSYGWLSVVFMICYLFTFGIGMGGLPWTINSEIYPITYRSLAVSYATATNWICNLLVAATFLSISAPQLLTAYGAFWMYAAVSVIGLIWLYVVLPETKGLHLEDIERLFQLKPLRGHGYDVVLESEENVDINDVEESDH